MFDRFLAQRLLGPHLNGLRRELGLPTTRRIFYHWLFETDLVLGLFPDWFGPPQPDWPANTRTVGFPLWDTFDAAPLSEDVHEFLAAGSPPIAFSPGSANNEAHQFFEAAVERVRSARSARHSAHEVRPPVAGEVAGVSAAFRFCADEQVVAAYGAVVHHGGIGSCAQGLAAGVPQIVRPMSYDQFDNSRRLVRLGVSKEISVRRFASKSVADALAQLLDSPTVAATLPRFGGAVRRPCGAGGCMRCAGTTGQRQQRELAVEVVG